MHPSMQNRRRNVAFDAPRVREIGLQQDEAKSLSLAAVNLPEGFYTIGMPKLALHQPQKFKARFISILFDLNVGALLPLSGFLNRGRRRRPRIDDPGGRHGERSARGSPAT